MNRRLSDLANDVGLSDPSNEALRLRFGLACVLRVRHLLEDPRALAGLEVLRGYVDAETKVADLRSAASEVEQLARSHRGSGSIDGSAHAAVSATHALAHALAGRAIEAAGYAAYASVYAYGGYAVSDPSAFEPEHAWQLEQLRELLSRSGRQDSQR